MDPKKHPLVLIEWTDARGGYSEWHYESDGCLDDGLCIVYTVGFLMRKRKDCYTVVMNITDRKDKDIECCDIMHIPRSSVRSIQTLSFRKSKS